MQNFAQCYILTNLTRSSRIFLASRDFFAASLFLFRLSKYFSSFCSSGIGRFSLLGLLIKLLQNIDWGLPTIGDLRGFGLKFGDFEAILEEEECEEKSELDEIFVSKRGGKLALGKLFE